MTQSHQPPTYHIDASDLKCPMPVIKLQQQIRQCNAGDVVAILCTDRGAEKDIASWCKVNRHTLLKCEYAPDNSALTLWVQKQ